MKNTNIEILNKVWELDEGFLGKLRHGVFDEELYQETYNILLNWRQDENDFIEKEVVSGLWFIPVFMERQKKIV